MILKLIKKIIKRSRLRKATKKWNEDIYLMESIIDETDGEYVYFKWSELVPQEIEMYIMIGKQVKPENLDSISRR